MPCIEFHLNPTNLTHWMLWRNKWRACPSIYTSMLKTCHVFFFLYVWGF